MRRGLQVENREAPQTQEDILRDLLPHLQYKAGEMHLPEHSVGEVHRPESGHAGLSGRAGHGAILGRAVRNEIPQIRTQPRSAQAEEQEEQYPTNPEGLTSSDPQTQSILAQIAGEGGNQQQGNPYANMGLQQLMQQPINGPPQRQYGPPQDITTPEQQRMNLVNQLSQKDPAAALKAMQEYEQFQHEKAMDLTKMQLEERANNAALVGPIGGQGTAAGDTAQQDQTAQNFQNQLALAQAKTGSNLPH